MLSKLQLFLCGLCPYNLAVEFDSARAFLLCSILSLFSAQTESLFFSLKLILARCYRRKIAMPRKQRLALSREVSAWSRSAAQGRISLISIPSISRETAHVLTKNQKRETSVLDVCCSECSVIMHKSVMTHQWKHHSNDRT